MLAPPRDRDDSPDFKTQSMASTGIRKGFTMSAGLDLFRAKLKTVMYFFYY